MVSRINLTQIINPIWTKLTRFCMHTSSSELTSPNEEKRRYKLLSLRGEVFLKDVAAIKSEHIISEQY